MTIRLVSALFLLPCILFFSRPGFSQEETPWQEGDFAESRLVASHKAVPLEEEGPLYVGWHIKLAENWKTYWRTPGDAGLPPLVDWEGSINVAKAELLYPVPERFEIFDLFTYGYHDEVVYPIRITPVVEGAPVTLKANIRFLVCDDLCVPMEAVFNMTIPAGDAGAPLSLHAGLIDRYLEQVPKENDGQTAPVKVIGFKVLGAGSTRNLVVRVSGENLLTGADLIVENSNSLKFGAPQKRILENADEAEFIVPVYGAGDAQTLENMSVSVIVSDGWGHAEEIVLDLMN